MINYKLPGLLVSRTHQHDPISRCDSPTHSSPSSASPAQCWAETTGHRDTLNARPHKLHVKSTTTMHMGRPHHLPNQESARTAAANVTGPCKPASNEALPLTEPTASIAPGTGISKPPRGPPATGRPSGVQVQPTSLRPRTRGLRSGARYRREATCITGTGGTSRPCWNLRANNSDRLSWPGDNILFD